MYTHRYSFPSHASVVVERGRGEPHHAPMQGGASPIKSAMYGGCKELLTWLESVSAVTRHRRGLRGLRWLATF